MIQTAESVNVRQVLRDSSTFGAEQVELLQRAAMSNQLSELRQEVENLRSEVDRATKPSEPLLVRLGVTYRVIGDSRQAARYLSRVSSDAFGVYQHALVLAGRERDTEAIDRFEQAEKLGYDQVECALRRAGCLRRLSELEEAESLVRGTGSEGARRAEYSYQMGCILSDRGDTYGAIEYFERAADMDPHHSRALFRLAEENSLRGNDEEAVQLYERSLSTPPQYLGALLNLGLLYEDTENYPAAAFCFRRILKVDPSHQRARLYLKDIEATGDMYYDEESAREASRIQQLLNRPINDFELTARSRNCLETLGIDTLGDLTRITEQDLLASKNFGETSLEEVQGLMAAEGLQIGQYVTAGPVPEPSYVPADVSPEEKSLMDRPIADLNLTVRARKCMTRLGITKIGELVQKTPDELLGTKNFGVTSLNEIRGKLDEMGLKLRND